MAQNRVLYWGSGSPPCWRVLMALEAKGLEYESKLLVFSKSEHKSEEVLALNPRGQLPTFKDGDAVVNESGAILAYLETQYPDKPLLPSDAQTKARVWQRVFEAVTTGEIFTPYVRGKFAKKEIPDEDAKIEAIKAELSRWDGYASKQKFIATDELTLADCMFAPFMMTMSRFGMTANDYPNVKKYIEMMKEHPIMKKTWPPHWAESEATQTFMNVV